MLLLISSKAIRLVSLVLRENVCCSREQSWLMEVGWCKIPAQHGTHCPPASPVKCLGLYPWHLRTMEQIPHLVCCQSSLLFSLLWENKNEQWGQGSKLQGPGGTVGESHGFSPDMRQTQSSHQGTAEILPGRGQLFGEVKVNSKPQSGEGRWFSSRAGSLSEPSCDAHLRGLELQSGWAALLVLFSQWWECSWGDINL